MTDNIDIESLKSEIQEIYKVIETNAKAKVSAERDLLIKDISSLSAELKKDFKPEDYKDVSLESLRFNKQVLQDVIGALKVKTDAGTGDLGGLITRGDGTLNELSGEQLEDALLDLIQLGFGLEPASDEIKAEIRLERMADGYTLRR